jgi:hypothetical protein
MIQIDYIGLGVSVFLILAFAAPIIFQVFKNRKLKNRMLQDFAGQFHQKGLETGLIETWRNRYILGLDKGSSRLLYWNDFEKEFKEVPLIGVREIDIHLLYHEVRKEKITDLMQLVFHMRGFEKISMEIYNGCRFSDLQGEFPLAEKWRELLRERLERMPKRDYETIA